MSESDEIEALLARLEKEQPAEAVEDAKSFRRERGLGEEDESRLNYGIAAGLFKLAEYEETLEWLEHTDDDRRHIFRGFCHIELEQFPKAVEAFDDAAGAEPDRRHEAHLMKAQSLMLNDQVEEAQRLYEDLVDRDVAENVDIESTLGLAVSYIETDDHTRAQPLLEELLDDHRETEYTPQILFYLVDVYESLGQVENAIDHAEKLKTIGEDTVWEDTASELLKRLHDQSNDRRSKLRNYEF